MNVNVDVKKGDVVLLEDRCCEYGILSGVVDYVSCGGIHVSSSPKLYSFADILTVMRLKRKKWIRVYSRDDFGGISHTCK